MSHQTYSQISLVVELVLFCFFFLLIGKMKRILYDEGMDGWMDGWMDRQMNGWMDGQINGWMDGYQSIVLLFLRG